MDYKKWDNLDQDENDNSNTEELEEDQINDEYSGVEIKRLYDIKYNADHLFSLFKFEQSLTLYHQIILELMQHPQPMTASCLATQELYILCHLNLACCYLKIKEWTQCITTINSVLSSNNTFSTAGAKLSSNAADMSHIMTPEKYTRCLYFKAYSLCELSHLDVNHVHENKNGESGLEVALKCCRETQNIISRTKHFADQSLVSEMDPLIARIQKCIEMHQKSTQATFDNTSSVSSSSSLPSTASSSSSSSSRDITTLLHESHRSIAMNQPLAALQSLKKCIALMKKRVGDGEDSVLDPRIVSCFQNMGDCYGRLQEYDEAITMYQTACDHIDEDADIIASHTTTTTTATDGAPDLHTNPDLATATATEELLLPPVFRARALHLKAGDCAYRSSSNESATLTSESDISRALQFYSTALAGLPRGKPAREAYVAAEGLSAAHALMALRLEASALQGVSTCYFQQKQYAEAIRTSELSVDIVDQIIESDTLFVAQTKTKNEANHVKVEIMWQKQMKSYHIMSFSHFYLSQFSKALDTLNHGFLFSTRYLKAYSAYNATTIAVSNATIGGGKAAPVTEQHLRPLKRNRLLLQLFLLKNQILLQLSLYDVDELSQVWEQIASCADSFATHQEDIEAGKLYKLSAEFFMSQSGRSAFNLNDKTSQLVSTPGSQRANELCALSAKYTKKYTSHLLTQLESEAEVLNLDDRQLEKLRLAIHKQFVSCIRVLFLQGVCADNLSQAQRHYEAAHSMREEYMRAQSATDSPSPLRPLPHDLLLQEEFIFLCGDISHHLAFTYMKCGKLLYALEECQLAISRYEEVHTRYLSLQQEESGDMVAATAADASSGAKEGVERIRNISLQALADSPRSLYPNESTGQRGLPGAIFRLRHAWGLLAVIRCQRREQALSTEALGKVQQLQPGPVVESAANEELERLTNILTVHPSKPKTKSKSQSQVSDTNQAILTENWNNARTKKNNRGKEKELGGVERTPVDGNLLFAYFVLTCTVAVIMYFVGKIFLT